MKIFGISDLHLSFSVENKAMDVFGPRWVEHWRKIETNWRELITPNDVVLVCGDISWGLRPPEAQKDLEWLSALPGQIVLTRGNHDLWWQSIGKLRQAYPRLHFVQNDAVTFGQVTICGTRGWPMPGSPEFKAQDQKIHDREVGRLRMAVQALAPRAPHRLAMLHYPPLYCNQLQTAYTEILQEAKIELCVYGHLHLPSFNPQCFDLDSQGIKYRLISADYLQFRPRELLSVEDD